MSDPRDDVEEWPVTRFLSLVTKEWVAYGSEGVSLRRSVQEIARQHDARAEVQMQPDSAVLSVVESGRVETITVAVRASSRISSRMCRIWVGSRPLVGSSRMTMSGWCRMACATPTRWR